MERSNFVLNHTDYNGDPIKITCEGVDDEKLAHFGGLDLTVKAARTLISATINPMSFPEKEGDHNIASKVVALLLNEVGELIRSSSFEPEYFEGISNLELVKSFLEDTNENREIKRLIEEDDSLIRIYKEKARKEEDEIWDDMKSDLHKDQS